MNYEYLDKDGAIFRVKAGEYPLRSAEVFDRNEKEWAAYSGWLYDLQLNGTPITEEELEPEMKPVRPPTDF